MCGVSLADDTEEKNLVLKLPAEGRKSSTIQHRLKNLPVFICGEPGVDSYPDQIFYQ